MAVELYRGESEPVATNPVLRGVDLAMDRLVREDCFTERTLRVLDELRAEVLGVTSPDDVRAHYEPRCPECGHAVREHYGRWCRVETGAINAAGRRLICCCTAVDRDHQEPEGRES